MILPDYPKKPVLMNVPSYQRRQIKEYAAKRGWSMFEAVEYIIESGFVELLDEQKHYDAQMIVRSTENAQE